MEEEETKKGEDRYPKKRDNKNKTKGRGNHKHLAPNSKE